MKSFIKLIRSIKDLGSKTNQFEKPNFKDLAFIFHLLIVILRYSNKLILTTQEFLEILATNQGKSLLFEYTLGKFVGANYHITEVKNIAIDSVNCGGGTEDWKETIIQLWESPTEKDKTVYMSTYKALSILKKVGRIKPYVLDAEVKFEYSNLSFHTAQLFVNDYEMVDKKIIIKLAVEKTDCKAKDICGVPETIEETQEACAPRSGCC